MIFLPIPSEPQQIKNWMKGIQHLQTTDSSRQNEASVLWAGNKLPKFLWDAWKSELKPLGLKWQDFMKILHHRSDVGVLWLREEIGWEEFVRKVSGLINGSIGNEFKKPQVKKMMRQDFGQWQLPPFQDWEKFERFCSSLWTEIWRDPGVQRFGRTGQRQNGVDISGRIGAQGKLAGLQCKKRDAYADDSLTVDELRKIVDEAMAFTPRLSSFIVTYTGRRDASLQQAARDISLQHRHNGLFSVEVFSWDDIVEALGAFPQVAEQYYPHLASNVNAAATDEISDNVHTLLENSNQHLEILSDIKAVIADPSQSVNRIAAEAIAITADTSSVVQEFSAELDDIKKLIDDFKPKEALSSLKNLESRMPSTVSGLVRYRLIANKAAATLAIGDEKQAGMLFIQCHQYNPHDEKAQCNRALGHMLLDQRPEAIRFVEAVLERNPVNVAALEILTHCALSEDSFKDIVSRIPEAVRDSPQIAAAIGHQARTRGDLPISMKWMETAIKNSTKPVRPDFLANFAITLLDSVKDKGEAIGGMKLTSADTARVQRAISLLTEAIDAVSNTETIKVRVAWFAGRSSAYMFLQSFDKALIDIEAAVKIEPDNHSFQKQHAVILAHSNRRPEGIQLLKTLVTCADVPEVSILLAEMLLDANLEDEAIEVLNNAIGQPTSAELQIEEQRLLLITYLKRKDFENARRISIALRSAAPTDILNIVLAAKIEKHSEDFAVGARLLDEARNYVSADTPPRYLMELGQELLSSKRFADAWPVLEKIADPAADTFLSERLLYSYYRAGEFEKAMSAVRSFPAEQKNLFATQIEVSILEDTGDLAGAAVVCQRYVSLHRDDIPMRLRYAMTLYRLGSVQELDELLDLPLSFKDLTLEEGLQFAGLHAERRRSLQSLKIAYELRRKYFDESEAHLKYVGLFFSREKEIEPYLERSVVEADTAVALREEGGTDQWYVIEEREDTQAGRSELKMNSPLALKLLGKKVNEEIILSEDSFGSSRATVTEIKSKYVHAFHESLNLFPVRFAGVPGLQRLTVRTGDNGQAVPEDMQKILDRIGARGKRVKSVEKAYLEGKIAIGTFSNLIGTNAIEIWGGLVGDSRRGVCCCNGSPEERQKALDCIGATRKVVSDITGLLTCHGLGILDVVKKVFPEVLIGQAILDELRQAISDRRRFSEKPFTTVWQEDGNYYRKEVTEEDIQRDIKHFESLESWVKTNCTIVPCALLGKLGLERRKELEKLIGPSFLEAILISQEQQVPLFCDDFGTRSFAEGEFAIGGVWTQAICIYALEKGYIKRDEYNQIAIKLARLNFRHTTIDASILIEAARESGWMVDSQFSAVLENSLAGQNLEIRSVVNVACECIYLLWKELIPDLQRDALIMSILDALTRQRRKDAVLNLLSRSLPNRFQLLPLAENRVRQIITAWRSLRP